MLKLKYAQTVKLLGCLWVKMVDINLEKYATAPALHNIEYEKKYFTQTGYEGYKDYPINGPRVEKIINMAHPKSVLDVGAAYGYIVKRLLEKGIHAIGMDISHWCEEQADKIIPGHFVRHDLAEIPYPFKDKEFDLLYCEGVLEHVNDTKVDAVMKEFERVSQSRLLALTFDWHLEEHPYSPESAEAPGHINLHNQNWWFEKMPKYTWLFIPATGIQDGELWLYKG